MKKDRFLLYIRNLQGFFKENRLKVGYVIVCCICLLFIGIYMEGKFDYRSDEVVCEEFPYDENSVYIVVSPEQKNPLSAINVKFADVEKLKGGTIFFDFLCDGEIIDQWQYSSDLFIQDSYKTLRLKKYISVGDNIYALKVSYKDPDGYECSSEVLVNNTITCKLTYHINRWNTAYWIMILIAFLVLLFLSIIDINEIILMDISLGIFVVLYLVICPFGMAPDSSHHFMRAYEIANVSLLSDHVGEMGVGGNYLPDAVEKYGNKDITVDWDKKSEKKFPGAALYSPITYLPQVIGIKIAQLITNRIHYIYLGGKLGNILSSLLLCFLALQIVPFGKRVFFMIMTFPVTLQELISIAPDGFTISLSLFFIAYLLNIKYTKVKVRRKDIVILGICGIVLSLLKIVYVVLLFLLFIIPISLYGGRKKWLCCNSLIITCAVLANAIWLKISMGYLTESNPGVNGVEQIKFILLDIHDYLFIFINTFIYNLGSWISTAISSDMGKLIIATPSIIWICILILFVLEILSVDISGYYVRKYDYIIPFIVFLCGIGLIGTSLYVQWTPVENLLIDGIQGRYFTPLLGCFAVAIILFKDTHIRIYREKSYRLFMYVFLANSIVLQDIFSYFIMNFVK